MLATAAIPVLFSLSLAFAASPAHLVSDEKGLSWSSGGAGEKKSGKMALGCKVGVLECQMLLGKRHLAPPPPPIRNRLRNWARLPTPPPPNLTPAMEPSPSPPPLSDDAPRPPADLDPPPPPPPPPLSEDALPPPADLDARPLPPPPPLPGHY